MNFKSLDAETAFTAGFAVRCAEEKLPEEEISTRIKFASALLEKEAWFKWLGEKLLGGGKSLAGMALDPNTYATALKAMAGTAGVGLAAGGLAGGVGGGALGWAAAKSQEKDIDPEDLKAKEIQQTYDHYAQRMAARRAYEQARAKRMQQEL